MTGMTMRTSRALALLAVVGLGQGAHPTWADEAAIYSVTFTRLWTGETHPFEYPKRGLLTGPHLSGLIGCSHNGHFALYTVGTPPSPGLENLSETGKHRPLDGEIGAAIAGGRAGALFETGPIRDAARTESTSVRVTDEYPRVSAVAMIAPSPDWFAGVADVDLKEDGRWVSTKTVDLYAYDSGGDDGTTYAAQDDDTNPKKPTTTLEDAHFTVGGKRPPVARLTFTKN